MMNVEYEEIVVSFWKYSKEEVDEYDEQMKHEGWQKQQLIIFDEDYIEIVYTKGYKQIYYESVGGRK